MYSDVKEENQDSGYVINGSGLGDDESAADMNGDGEVNIFDILAMVQAGIRWQWFDGDFLTPGLAAAALLGEPLSWRLAAAALLILGGIAATSRRA